MSYVAAFVALARIAFPAHAARRGGAGWRESWVEGFRYVTGFAPARMLLTLVAVLAWTILPYVSLMPAFAKDVHGGGPGTLGLPLATAGGGALVATLYLAARRSVVGLGRVIAWAAAASGAGLAAFAMFRTLPAALPVLFVVGGGVILAAASANTILQTIVDDRLRGRVAGFYMLAFLGVAPLGNLVAGALAARLGVPATFVANGVMALAASLAFMRALPALRRVVRSRYRELGLVADRGD